MADNLEETLIRWGASADGDLDLRTEGGIHGSAERYAERMGVSMQVALDAVMARIERQKAVSVGAGKLVRRKN